MPTTTSDKLKPLVHSLPNKPGVYQYFDAEGKIIYVGKAKNLKKRVGSYFTKTHQQGKLRLLVKKIDDIKFIVTDSEYDALLLENNLIKKYQPRYNIQLKDDKTYPWICIKKEHFPRIFSIRNITERKSEYYGPYASVRMMKTLLGIIKDLYPIRTCSLNLSPKAIETKNYKVCLEYHIGNCKAPCVGKQSEEEYDQIIEHARKLIKGNIHGLIVDLKKIMHEFAEDMEFEKAQHVKEQIKTLENYKSKSTIVSPKINNVDVISIIEDGNRFYVNYLKVVAGAIVQAHTIEIRNKLDESPQEILLLAMTDFRKRFDPLKPGRLPTQPLEEARKIIDLQVSRETQKNIANVFLGFNRFILKTNFYKENSVQYTTKTPPTITRQLQ